MRSKDIRVGREYNVKIWGQTRVAKVVDWFGSPVQYWRVQVFGGGGKVYEIFSRAFISEVPSTPEQDMNALIAYVDGGLFLNSPVDAAPEPAGEINLRKARAAVFGYTEDGLPLTAAAVAKTLPKPESEIECPSHGKLCHGAYCKARETRRVYNEAMARS